MNKNADNIVIYTDDKGKIKLRADIERETIWASQAEIAHLFLAERSVVTKHIQNIFSDNEVDKKSNVQILHIAKSDRPVSVYSLDIILAVGYRTNSANAIKFRVWATSILREYLVKGYTINGRGHQKLPEQMEGLTEAIDLIRSNRNPGKLKGRITIRLTKNLEQNNQ